MTSVTEESSCLEQSHGERAATQQKTIDPETEVTSTAQSSSVTAEADSTVDLQQVNVHLANERTFLAWVWTGMLLMGFGVGIAKMRIAMTDFSQSTGSVLQFRVNHEISPILMGLLFVIVGMVTIFMFAYRYLAVQNQLRKQTYTHSDSFVLVFLVALILLSDTLIVLVMQMR